MDAEATRGQRLSLLLGGPPRVWALTGALAAAALAVQLLALGGTEATQAPLTIPWWALLVLCAAAELVVVNLSFGRDTQSFSLGEIPLIAGLAFADPAVVVAASVAGIGIALLRRRQPPVKLAFNLAAAWLHTVLAVVVWRLVLGPAPVTGVRGWLAILVVTLVIDVLSAASVALVITLAGGGSPLATFRDGVIGGIAEALTNGCFAVVVLTVLVADWRAAWALLAVALVLVGAYRSYLSLQRRHDSLERLAAFTRAIDGDLRARPVAERIVAEVRELLGAEVVELVWREGDDTLRLVHGEPHGTTGDGPADAHLRVVERVLPAGAEGPGGADDPGLAARLLRAAPAPLLIPRGTRDARLRAALTATGLRDAVVAPLGPGGQDGTLLAADRQGELDSFDRHDLHMLSSLAGHALVALSNGRLADRLRRQAAQREHEARHDGLTGLANRRRFHEDAAALLRAGTVAVLLVDLDRFKEINDTLGHGTGDRLLAEVGRRLRASLPPDAAVARLGGDEFAAALPGADEAGATAAAAAVRAALAQPFAMDGLPLLVDGSIGIALAPEDGNDPEVLLQRADVAMYGAKRARTGTERYAAERDQYSPTRLALVAELREAIASGALTVDYQPKARMRDGQVVGVEALVRWNHPRHGFIPPDEFVPVAEHTGLLRPLTLHVLRLAVRQGVAWREEGLDLGVAVNLSARSLKDQVVIDDVQELLRTSGFPPELLTLEITESDLVDEPDLAVAVLERLARLGIHRSVDDFGTGYSSLSYLNRLPIDELKIDRSFVMAMPGNPDAVAIVGAVVDLGRRLRKSVVAEGVEDDWTWSALADLGCDLGQGYVLSRPQPAEQLTPWLLARRSARPTIPA